METEEVEKIRKTYEPKRYETEQIGKTDEINIYDDDLYLGVLSDAILSLWRLTNRIQPIVNLPIRWNDRTKTYEFVKASTITAGGLTKVAIGGAGFEKVDLKDGTAGVNWSDAIALDWVANRIRAESMDYPYMIRLSSDNIYWTDPVYVDEGTPRQYDIATKYFKVRRYGGNDATYYIMGIR